MEQSQLKLEKVALVCCSTGYLRGHSADIGKLGWQISGLTVDWSEPSKVYKVYKLSVSEDDCESQEEVLHGQCHVSRKQAWLLLPEAGHVSGCFLHLASDSDEFIVIPTEVR